jgi:preprotein translocase subunit SecG
MLEAAAPADVGKEEQRSMLSLLLIILDAAVCVALTLVVLMQRSEGGAFGMGGGPTGLITARGAGDLLTRTTWVLFSLFLGLSLALTLLGAHDRASSGLADKLKLQQANTNALNAQAAPPPGLTNAPLPAQLLAPPPASAPSTTAPVAPAPAPTLAAPPARPTSPHATPPKPAPAAAAAPPPPALVAPAPVQAPPAGAAPASSAPAGAP